MRFFMVIAAIANVTFREIIRDKILYNIVLWSAFLLGASVLASQLAILKQDRVVLDLGLLAIAISSVMIAVFTGAGMIGREFERRTVFIALSRPISRMQFVMGKYVGLLAVLLVNWLLFGLGFLLILNWTGGASLSSLGSAFWWAVVFVLFQSAMVASIAVMFSCFTTTSLTVMFTIGLYLVGNNLSQIRWLSGKLGAPASWILNGLTAVLPDFEHFQLGTKVTYALPVSVDYGLTAMGHAALVVGVMIFLAGWFIRGREA